MLWWDPVLATRGWARVTAEFQLRWPIGNTAEPCPNRPAIPEASETSWTLGEEYKTILEGFKKCEEESKTFRFTTLMKNQQLFSESYNTGPAHPFRPFQAS